MQEIQVRSQGREDPLEKEMATYSSVLAWEIPFQRSLVSYSPWGCKELDTTEGLIMQAQATFPTWKTSIFQFERLIYIHAHLF